MDSEDISWRTRGYLPHFEAGERLQFLTWRQADSLPPKVIDGFRREASGLSESAIRRKMSVLIEGYCNEGHGSCVMANQMAARMVQEELFSNHGRLYGLMAWVVMPNHVHLVLKPATGVSLGTITKTIKGASSRRINEILGLSGRLWQPEYFDRCIRNDDHLHRVVKYIEWNPVKARLVADPRHYRWSSANPDSLHRLQILDESRVL